MRALIHRLEALPQQQVVRYVANGLAATAVHFGALQINLRLLGMSSAGFANFIAAFFGITVSYIGSRYFVFQARHQPIFRQASKFGVLYGGIALLHGAVLYVWSDLQGWDYRVGFGLATVMQVLLSYSGNKLLVFNK